MLTRVRNSRISPAQKDADHGTEGLHRANPIITKPRTQPTFPQLTKVGVSLDKQNHCTHALKTRHRHKTLPMDQRPATQASPYVPESRLSRLHLHHLASINPILKLLGDQLFHVRLVPIEHHSFLSTVFRRLGSFTFLGGTTASTRSGRPLLFRGRTRRGRRRLRRASPAFVRGRALAAGQLAGRSAAVR